VGVGGQALSLYHRKFSTSISSLPARSICEYRIQRPSGETARLTTGFSNVATGPALCVSKLRNWIEEFVVLLCTGTKYNPLVKITGQSASTLNF